MCFEFIFGVDMLFHRTTIITAFLKQAQLRLRVNQNDWQMAFE